MEEVRLGKENVDFLLFANDMVLIAEFLQLNLKKLDKTLIG